MKKVQIALPASLVERVDREASAVGMTRSAFIQDALRTALERLRRHELEEKHRAGYTSKPVQPGEFS